MTDWLVKNGIKIPELSQEEKKIALKWRNLKRLEASVNDIHFVNSLNKMFKD